MLLHDVSEVRALEPLFGEPSVLAVSAKQLVLEVVPVEWVRQLNFDWHSQLPELGGLAFGDLRVGHALTFDGGVYGVAMWTRPIAANRMAHRSDHLVELRRLAIPDYAPKYAASRMLGQMARWFRRERPDVCRLLSYQMTDVHSGTIYKASNWSPARRQPADERMQNRSWSYHTKTKAVDVSTATTVRWELQLHKCDEPTKPADPTLL